jgi:hypothetical protein
MRYRSGDSPTPPLQSVTFEQATLSAPREVLEQLILRLWCEYQNNRSLIDDALRYPIAGSGGLKRRAFETCRNCHEHYDVTENKMGLCRYHECKLCWVTMRRSYAVNADAAPAIDS